MDLISQNGIAFRIDADDYDIVRPHRWHVYATGGGGLYVMTEINGKRWYLHRLLLQPAPNEMVDHINGDPLDCRRANMRTVTPLQNSLNRRLKLRRRKKPFRSMNGNRPQLNILQAELVTAALQSGRQTQNVLAPQPSAASQARGG